MRDLTVSPSTDARGREAPASATGPVDVAELVGAVHARRRSILRDALGLGDGVDVNPSGGALAANPVMVTGLVRIGEAARQVAEQATRPRARPRDRGPGLQQNLVCVLEGARA